MYLSLVRVRGRVTCWDLYILIYVDQWTLWPEVVFSISLLLLITLVDMDTSI
jgi:hypothetical protein